MKMKEALHWNISRTLRHASELKCWTLCILQINEGKKKEQSCHRPRAIQARYRSFTD